MLSETLRSFLLDGPEPSVRALVRVDLLDAPADDPDLCSDRSQIGHEGWAGAILREENPDGSWGKFSGDPDELYLPKYTAANWRLIELSDLGCSRSDARVAKAAELLLDKWSQPESSSLGGPGSEVCITGNSVRMLTRLGYGDDPRVRAALDWLVASQKEDGGWHCFPSETGSIDGWEAMAAFAALPASSRTPPISRAIERGAEFYLERGLLRETNGERNPPWERIHYPNHYYYDVLVGLDFLTSLGYGGDRRLRPAVDLLDRKRMPDGTYPLEAAHPDLTAEDPYHPRTPVYPVLFEYPGQPSRWATALALRVHRRIDAG
jgi:hypothetical protein